MSCSSNKASTANFNLLNKQSIQAVPATEENFWKSRESVLKAHSDLKSAYGSLEEFAKVWLSSWKKSPPMSPAETEKLFKEHEEFTQNFYGTYGKLDQDHKVFRKSFPDLIQKLEKYNRSYQAYEKALTPGPESRAPEPQPDWPAVQQFDQEAYRWFMEIQKLQKAWESFFIDKAQAKTLWDKAYPPKTAS